MGISDAGNYGCAAEYSTEGKISAIESTYVTVLAACGSLTEPDNGALSCSGNDADSDRTCEVLKLCARYLNFVSGT